MDEERAKIVSMLAEGTITVEEAYQLLDAIDAAELAAPAAATGQTQRIEPQPRSEVSGQAGNLFANLTLDQLIPWPWVSRPASGSGGTRKTTI